MRTQTRAGSAALVLWLCGCGVLGPYPDLGPVYEDAPGPGERAVGEALEAHERAEREPPEAVRSLLLPPLPGVAPVPPPSEARFDISVNRVPAQRFFLSLVEDTPYNIVVHPGATGEISLQLKSVTIEDVLETVRELYGYGYREAAGVIHVTPPQLRTEVFRVDYLNVRRAGRSRTRVSSGQVSEQGSNTRNRNNNDNNTSSSSRVIGGEQRTGSVSGSVISTDSEANLWKELTESVEAIIGLDGGRVVVASPNSGTLAVRAMPGELRDVADYLRTVQQSLERQVVLEAKVIEVTLDDGFRSGINWAYAGTLGADNFLIGSQTGGGTSLGSTGLSEIAGNLGNLDPRDAILPPSGTDTSAFGGVFTLAIEGERVNAFLEFLEAQGDTQVLSSPRVATLNNQKAVIKVGSDEFFVTDVSTTTVQGTTTTTNPDITLTPFFSGIALDVTPQVSDDGFITLHIHPSVSEVVDQTKTISLGTDTLTLPLAFSTIRETDTVVRAKSGQVIVIGGLMQDNSSDRSAATPFLSKLPWLGSAFRHSAEATLKKELVILLQPITVGPDTWRASLQKSFQRLQSFRGAAGSP